MKIVRRTKQQILKNKNRENVPNLQITEVVLVHFNIVNNTYQNDSTVLHPFIPNKLFRQLSESSPTNLILLKTFN